MTVHQFADLPTEVSYRRIQPIPYWDEREYTYQQVQMSEEIFRQMDPLVRKVVVARVKSAMEVMYDNIEEWLPAAFTLTDGDTLDVHFKITKTNIESDVIQATKITSFKLKEASEDLKNIMIEMELEDEAIDSESEGR